MLYKIVKRSLDPIVAPQHRNLKLQDSLVSQIAKISDDLGEIGIAGSENREKSIAIDRSLVQRHCD